VDDNSDFYVSNCCLQFQADSSQEFQALQTLNYLINCNFVCRKDRVLLVMV